MKVKQHHIAIMALTIGLGACAPLPSQQSSNPVMDGVIRQQVDQQLSQSAGRAANALETLALIQRVRTKPAAPALNEDGLPAELKMLTTIEWHGNADELAKELAANVGYTFLESGSRPSVPPKVNVDIKDVPAAKAFEDIGLQVQQWATVIVDPNIRRVEFRNEASNSNQPTAPFLRPARRHGESFK